MRPRTQQKRTQTRLPKHKHGYQPRRGRENKREQQPERKHPTTSTSTNRATTRAPATLPTTRCDVQVHHGSLSVWNCRALYRRGGMLSGNPGGGGSRQPFSTSKGLLKGSGGIPTLLPPSYFHVFSLISCIKVSFVDNNEFYTLLYTAIIYFTCIEARGTCEKKKG
jgi:hypothetical protein